MYKDDLRINGFYSLTKRNDTRGSVCIICIIWPTSHKQFSRKL